MDETWISRDLPVLRAAVKLCEEKRVASREDLIEVTGFDKRTVILAFDALAAEQPPFFDELSNRTTNAGYRAVAAPTGHARRTVGTWPTPESFADAVIARLQQTADDEAASPEMRERAKQGLVAFLGAGKDILIGAAGSILATGVIG
ncbi:hypothetical protein ACIBM3_10295 [Rhodococcus erythropolis]|uniref:hypothetical protein n=1 Tax=Rhodococcus erythropolis TaxID=1833 RepID=UPI00378F28F2